MCRGLYAVLGVSRNASRDTIRKSYLKLAKVLHPDVNKARGAQQQFQELQKAYDVLGDAQKRLEHDRALGMSQQEKPRAQRASQSSSSSTSSRNSAGEAGDRWSSASQHWSGSGQWTGSASAQEQRRQQAYAWQERQQQQWKEQFDQQRYYQEVSRTALRAVFLLTGPLLLISALFARYLGQRSAQNGKRAAEVMRDDKGRAFICDAHGGWHRVHDLDAS
mmetsp:Transcript_51855/g.116940  ORF Transcript_51855/g.116940 Transcript_51855/m.116940 type:complete len:220 (+) Transcript_51855:71-730(+)